MHLDINLCAGLLSRNSVSVLCWSNRANHRSLLSLRDFLNKDLTIFTADPDFGMPCRLNCSLKSSISELKVFSFNFVLS